MPYQNAQTFSFVFTAPGQVIEQTYLLPHRQKHKEEFFKEFYQCREDLEAYDLIQDHGMVLHDSTGDKLVRPAQIEYNFDQHGTLYVAQTHSFYNGDYLPYFNNRHQVCAFQFNEGKMLCGIGLAQNTGRRKIKYTDPIREERQAILIENGHALKHIKNMQPSYKSVVAPAAYMR
ncbi:MAG: hypothetical protein JWM96_11 [Alphaproteobacteria bacterium]|nr:hypothetical protein [Alphaproteobacteria bacterium]